MISRIFKNKQSSIRKTYNNVRVLLDSKIKYAIRYEENNSSIISYFALSPSIGRSLKLIVNEKFFRVDLFLVQNPLTIFDKFKGYTDLSLLI